MIDDQRMPFTEHLVELRLRLRNSVAGVLVATVVAWVYKERLLMLLERPLAIAWSRAPVALLKDLPPEINFTNLIDPFMVYLKLTLLAGLFGASPVVFHQIWRFISPGLYPRERRLALPFIVISVLLFVGGGAFAYFFVLPSGYEYFLGFTTQSLETMRGAFGQHGLSVRLRPMLTMDEYFSLTSSLLLAFGGVFELPLLLSVLSMLGIVTPRGLWRFNRYAILIFFVLGAFLTPGDMIGGQIAMGISLTVLYNLSILVSLVFARRRRAQEAAGASSA